MLTINDTQYSAHYFTQQVQTFDEMDLSENGKGGIAVCLEDTALWLALCFYCQRHRLSVMPIHPTTPKQTAQRMAEKAGCSVLYYHTLTQEIALDGETAATAQPGLIQMSSGTTGEPKCIRRSWDDIDEEIKSYIATFTKANEMTPVVACPVTHSYGLICGVMVALCRGQTPIIVTNINPKYLMKTLLSCKHPLLYSSPAMLQGLMLLWRSETPLHAAMTSGTTLSQATFKLLQSKVTHLFQQYGCSEAGCIAINQQMRSPQEIGTPLPHLKVHGSTDAAHPAEFVITLTPNDPQQPLKTIHTQDLGYIQTTEDGQAMMHFIARQDDTIIVAGLNVYPQEVEDILLTHPDIDDALVFKTDDPLAGQRVCLHYVSAQEIDPRTLRNWCCEHLASYQVPQQLRQVEQIERMANGKVNRKKVAMQYQQQNEVVKQKIA